MKLRLNKYSKQAHGYSLDVGKLKDEEIRKRYEDQIPVVLKIEDVPNDTGVEELWKTVKMAITVSRGGDWEKTTKTTSGMDKSISKDIM